MPIASYNFYLREEKRAETLDIFCSFFLKSKIPLPQISPPTKKTWLKIPICLQVGINQKLPTRHFSVSFNFVFGLLRVMMS